MLAAPSVSEAASVVGEFAAELEEARRARGETTGLVTQISYPADFKDVSVLLAWALRLKPAEHSPRMLRLTGAAIDLNAADYSAWEFRREVLVSLCGSAAQIGMPELEFCTDAINETPKNYQVWHHRRFLVEKAGLSSCEGELRFAASFILGDDGKNLFAWGHRIFCVTLWGHYTDQELSFSAIVIDADLRNHSAWNYRMFVASRYGLRQDRAMQRSELAFGMKYAELAPHSESAWSYLRAVADIADRAGNRLWPEVEAFAAEISENVTTSIHACSVWLDGVEKSHDQTKANEICMRLQDLDPIRKSYWASRLNSPSEISNQ